MRRLASRTPSFSAEAVRALDGRWSSHLGEGQPRWNKNGRLRLL